MSLTRPNATLVLQALQHAAEAGHLAEALASLRSGWGSIAVVIWIATFTRWTKAIFSTLSKSLHVTMDHPWLNHCGRPFRRSRADDVGIAKHPDRGALFVGMGLLLRSSTSVTYSYLLYRNTAPLCSGTFWCLGHVKTFVKVLPITNPKWMSIRQELWRFHGIPLPVGSTRQLCLVPWPKRCDLFERPKIWNFGPGGNGDWKWLERVETESFLFLGVKFSSMGMVCAWSFLVGNSWGVIDDSSPGDLRLSSDPEAGEKWADAEKSCTVFCDQMESHLLSMGIHILKWYLF